MNKLNRTAKLAYFNARRNKNDANLISEYSNTPKYSVFRMLSGRQRISHEVAEEAFYISKGRSKNSLIRDFSF